MSYVRLDDQHENGRLSQLRERLSGEVRMQTGEVFEIFQDRNDIAWGQQWQDRIENSLDGATFLIPILTPAFFRSPACRDEFMRFLEREKKLGRNDLILPLYYVECAVLSDETRRAADEIAATVAARQYADWRELRFEPFTSPDVGRRLAGMARQIVDALERGKSSDAKAPYVVAPESRTDRTSTNASVAQPKGVPAEDSERASGPAARTEPPVLVVDALHRGDHATLSAAIRAARPGTRIMVRPGLYQEGVVIDKPIEIVGDGDRADIVIQAQGRDTILFKSSMGRVANLTLRQAGRGEWYCVDIAQGRLDLEDCDISSQGLSCVAIHGGADPRVRRNLIHDGKQVGVLIYDSALGTLEDNEIFANESAGVAIKDGGNPALRRNRIHDGKQCGVLTYESGLGTLEDNEIFTNTKAAVEITTGANPVLRRNRIHDGKASGVFVYESGLGTLEANEIFALYG